MSQESREYTVEETREKLLRLIHSYVDYWSEISDKTVKERLDGLAFGILVILDGGSPEIPGFVLAPAPHEDDKAYHIKHGENYYPEDPKVDSDIGGFLHELYYKVRD